jgi:TolA-binding protein
LEIQARLSKALKASDEVSLINKLTSLYGEAINDTNSTRNEKLKAKDSLAELLFISGQKDLAYSLALENLNNQPRMYRSSTIIFAMTNEKASEYINNRQFDDAISECQYLLKLPLCEGYLAATEYEMGRIYGMKGDNKLCIEAYQRLADNYPFIPNWASRAYLSMAEKYVKMENYAKATESLNLLVTKYPHTRYSAKAKALLNKMSGKTND